MALEPSTQTAIRLDSFHVSKLDFNIDSSLWQTQELNETQFKINFQHLIKDSDKGYFGVLFKIYVQNENKTIDIYCEFIGHFEAKGMEIDMEILDSNMFFKHSAPAILFPYIRAFISNFTLNAGFKPLILPSINFYDTKVIEEDK